MQLSIVSAWIGTACAQEDAAAAHAQWRSFADQFRPKVLKLAALMDSAEEGVLPYMHFPVAHRAKLHSTNPIERPNGEIKCRTDVVGISPNEAAVVLVWRWLLNVLSFGHLSSDLREVSLHPIHQSCGGSNGCEVGPYLPVALQAAVLFDIRFCLHIPPEDLPMVSFVERNAM